MQYYEKVPLPVLSNYHVSLSADIFILRFQDLKKQLHIVDLLWFVFNFSMYVLLFKQH